MTTTLYFEERTLWHWDSACFLPTEIMNVSVNNNNNNNKNKNNNNNNNFKIITTLLNFFLFSFLKFKKQSFALRLIKILL